MSDYESADNWYTQYISFKEIRDNLTTACFRLTLLRLSKTQHVHTWKFPEGTLPFPAAT